MGFKREKTRVKTIKGQDADVVFNYEKLNKEDGLVFTVTDAYFDKSEENGEFCMLINDDDQTRLFAPALEVEGLKACYEDGIVPDTYQVTVVEHISKTTKRTYFTLNY